MAAISEKTIRRLFAMSKNMCAFPDCPTPIVEDNGTVTGEICHIRAHRRGGPRFDEAQSVTERHSFDNLILLCRRHHKIVDEEPELYTVEALEKIKAVQRAQRGRPEQPIDAFYAKVLLNALRGVEVNNNSGNILVDSPGAIVGHTVNVKSSRGKLIIQAPAGTIGADQAASRYIQYLIKRYNNYAADEPNRERRFSHGAISKNIEGKFGSQWKLLSMSKFNDLCMYLQTRISRTRIAKLNNAKGHKAFSTFSDFTRERD